MSINIEVVNPSAKLIDINKLKEGFDETDLPPCYYVMEHIGRVCYNSYHKPKTERELISFLSHGASRGHRSIFEFGTLHFSVQLYHTDFSRAYDRLLKNKYIKLSYTKQDDNEYLLTIKGSPRAFCEILEDMVMNDQSISLCFFKALWQALQDTIPVVIDNWETVDSISNYALLAMHMDTSNATYYMEDITNIYNSFDKFTKYLFMIQCSRSESHEIVRHRPCSFMQASQRYIRYGEKNPYLICIGTDQMQYIDIVKESAKNAFDTYTSMLENKVKAEDARVVLPNCTETKIFIYCDKEEYEHFHRMRTSGFAYPPVREVFKQVDQQLVNKKYK